jgi:hypothetical protein
MGTHSTARDHTHRDALWCRPHADSDVLWARETHRTTPHTHHTDLLLVGNGAARAGGSLRGAYTGSVRSRQSRPIQPTTTSRRCHGHRRGEASGSSRPARGAPCTPHGRMEHALMPSHRAAPRPPRAQAHMDNITFTDASRLCVSPPGRHQTRHRTCSLAQQPGSTSTVAPHGDADRPGMRQTPSTTRSWQRSTRPSGIAPDAAHHRKPTACLRSVKYACTTQRWSACTATRRYWANQSCCTREWHRGMEPRAHRAHSGCAGNGDGRPGRKGGSKEHR